jgi:hypothetical protein
MLLSIVIVIVKAFAWKAVVVMCRGVYGRAIVKDPVSGESETRDNP